MHVLYVCACMGVCMYVCMYVCVLLYLRCVHLLVNIYYVYCQSFPQHYYIARENLKEKYKGYEDRIKCFSKAIADQVRSKIVVQAKANRTVQFIITGRRNGVKKALLEIQREFEISKVIYRNTFASMVFSVGLLSSFIHC